MADFKKFTVLCPCGKKHEIIKRNKPNKYVDCDECRYKKMMERHRKYAKRKIK